MPTFSFVAIDQVGKTVSGVRSAATRQEMIGRLRGEGLVVTSVAQDAGPVSGGRGALSDLKDTLVLGRVRQGDLLVFTRQFGAMLKAGVSLTDALHTIAHTIGNPRLHQILLAIRSDVQRGQSLTDAMRKHPVAFNQLFISIVQAGETSGSLAQNIARLSQYLDRQERFRRKLKSATAYPKFVVGFFVVITSFIFLFLLPRFKALFEDLGAKLPRLTQVMLDFSTFLRDYFLIIAPAVILLIIALLMLRRTPAGGAFADRVALKIPFFGKLFLQAAVARMAMTLSTLISNGIPLTDALQLATGTLSNSLLEEGCRNVRKDVMQGHGLAESFSRVPQMPRLLPRMVRVGEESGTLSGMLEDVASYYDQEVDVALSRITAVIEPVLIIGMGAVVLVTVIAIYLPIFSLGRTLRHG